VSSPRKRSQEEDFAVCTTICLQLANTLGLKVLAQTPLFREAVKDARRRLKRAVDPPFAQELWKRVLLKREFIRSFGITARERGIHKALRTAGRQFDEIEGRIRSYLLDPKRGRLPTIDWIDPERWSVRDLVEGRPYPAADIILGVLIGLMGAQEKGLTQAGTSIIEVCREICPTPSDE